MGANCVSPCVQQTVEYEGEKPLTPGLVQQEYACPKDKLEDDEKLTAEIVDLREWPSEDPSTTESEGEKPIPGPVPGCDEPAVTVTVVGARGLRNADWLPGPGSSSETYVVVKMDGKELHTTKAIGDSLEPFWREEMTIPDWAVGQRVEFEIYDRKLSGEQIFLGRVPLESHFFEMDGFNGDRDVQDSGDDLQAYLRLKCKLGGKAAPKGPTTNLHFHATMGSFTSWGLDLDTQDCLHLYLTDVRSGPFQEANFMLDPSDTLMKGDYIVSVNGVTGFPATLLNEFKNSKEVTVQAVRSIETSLVFEIPEMKKMNLGLRFPHKPSGENLVICHIDDNGAAGKYNKSQPNEMLQLRRGDRIVALDGFRGKAPDLLAKANKLEPGKHQVIVLRWTCDIAKSYYDLQ